MYRSMSTGRCNTFCLNRKRCIAVFLSLQRQQPAPVRGDISMTTAACALCGKKEGDLLSCGKCLVTRYCCERCQSSDFTVHRHVCAAIEEYHAARTAAQEETTPYSLDLTRHLNVDMLHVEEAMIVLSLANGKRLVQSSSHADEMPRFPVVPVMRGEFIVAAAVELVARGRAVGAVAHIVRPDGQKKSIAVAAFGAWPFCTTEIGSTTYEGAHTQSVVFMYPEEWPDAVRQALLLSNSVFREIRGEAPSVCLEQMATVAQKHAVDNVWRVVRGRVAPHT